MKNYILTGLFALGLLVSGCGDNQIGVDDMIDDPVEGNAILYISLQGSEDPTRATGTGNNQYENVVKTFTAYVFSSGNGALEAKREFLSGEVEGEIEGLGTATHKDIVVLVNYPGTYPDGDSYNDLTAELLSLDSQDPLNVPTAGLFMSGEEKDVTLTVDGPNEITVDVSRVVAKVRLMSLNVNPTSALISDFELTSVSVQRVRNTTNMFGGLLTTGFDYVGGFQTATSGLVPVDYLVETVTLPTNYTAGDNLFDTEAEIPYFYVFPNDDEEDSSTLISIQGKYKGDEMFYSYRINDELLSDGQSEMDGEWIKRNTIYNIYFTLDKIELGGDDPNVPNVIVTAKVIVKVLGWDNTIVQYIHY